MSFPWISVKKSCAPEIDVEEAVVQLHAFLVVPFWLSYTNRPFRGVERVRLLTESVQWLKRHRSSEVIDWRLVELEARQKLESVAPPKQWHPLEITARKRSLLTGELKGEEHECLLQLGIDPKSNAYSARIVRRTIAYYDYGIGSLEYEFLFEPKDGSTAFNHFLKDERFWKNFTDGVCDAVIDRSLAALGESVFNPAMDALVHALAHGYACLEGLKFPSSGSASEYENWFRGHLIPVQELFGLDAFHGNGDRLGTRGRRTENLNMLFALTCDHDVQRDDLERFVKAIIGGMPVDHEGKLRSIEEEAAASDYLNHVFHGAAYSLITIKPNDKTVREAAVQAAKYVFRYLAVGYAALTDASRGLIDRQVEFGFGQNSALVDIKHTEYLSNIIVSDFQPTNFWDTDFEQDIYQRGYSIWGMPEKVKAFRESLIGVRDAEEDIRQKIFTGRQNKIQGLLASIAVLTIISAVTDLFTFGGFFDDDGNLRIDVAHVRFALSFCLVTLCVILGFVVWSMNRSKK